MTAMKGRSLIMGLALLMAVPAMTWAAGSQTPGVPAVADAGQAAEAVQAPRSRAVWIDVRTPREFEAGHLPGAILIPFDEIEARITREVPDRETPIMLYCRSGSRAEVAREALLKMGYTRVENRGAYRDLLKAGEPR